jgi:hypothetical protein
VSGCVHFDSFSSRPNVPSFAQAQTVVEETEPKTKSAHVLRVTAERQATAKIDPLLESQFQAGRLYASISSRPGQSGRADGYVLEGKELEVNPDYLLRGGSIADETGSSSTSSVSGQRSSHLAELHAGGESTGMQHCSLKNVYWQWEEAGKICSSILRSSVGADMGWVG